MPEKIIELLPPDVLEDITLYIATGVTPRQRAARALWTARTLLARERQGSEEWDKGCEARRGSHATR